MKQTNNSACLFRHKIKQLQNSINQTAGCLIL